MIGALAPVLTPGEAGERRSVLAALPILRQNVADRRTANSEWAADLGEVADIRWMTADEITRDSATPVWMHIGLELVERKRLALGW